MKNIECYAEVHSYNEECINCVILLRTDCVKGKGRGTSPLFYVVYSTAL